MSTSAPFPVSVTVPKQVARGYGPLPASNISQKLFESQLPNCERSLGAPADWQPSPCCLKSIKLGSWYDSAPVNLWNTAGNHEGGPPSNNCTEDAFLKQCFLSQHFNYLSGNNTIGN
jgi:hypothetical protein